MGVGIQRQGRPTYGAGPSPRLAGAVCIDMWLECTLGVEFRRVLRLDLLPPRHVRRHSIDCLL